MRFYIVPIKISECANCLIKAEFNKANLRGLLRYTKVGFQCHDNLFHDFVFVTGIGFTHELYNIFLCLCFERLCWHLYPWSKLICLTLHLFGGALVHIRFCSPDHFTGNAGRLVVV
jgi:hypothetical protein